MDSSFLRGIFCGLFSNPQSFFSIYKNRSKFTTLKFGLWRAIFLNQECVPVILSDQVELPFQDVVDYSKISIKLPSTSIGPQLLDYLGSIPGRSTAFFVTFYFKIPFLPSHD